MSAFSSHCSNHQDKVIHAIGSHHVCDELSVAIINDVYRPALDQLRLVSLCSRAKNGAVLVRDNHVPWYSFRIYFSLVATDKTCDMHVSRCLKLADKTT